MATVPAAVRQIVEHFGSFCVSELGIERDVRVVLVGEDQVVDEPGNHTAGMYAGDRAEARVAVRGRKLSDALRTLAHELTHHRQHEMGYLGRSSKQETEDEANAMAGRLLKQFGDLVPEIYSMRA